MDAGWGTRPPNRENPEPERSEHLADGNDDDVPAWMDAVADPLGLSEPAGTEGELADLRVAPLSGIVFDPRRRAVGVLVSLGILAVFLILAIPATISANSQKEKYDREADFIATSTTEPFPPRDATKVGVTIVSAEPPRAEYDGRTYPIRLQFDFMKNALLAGRSCDLYFSAKDDALYQTMQTVCLPEESPGAPSTATVPVNPTP